MTARYAVYFAPAPDTDFWRRASAVIGRDAVTGTDLPFPPVAPCDAPDWRELTDEPRRYGFHATLKAPFELVEAADEDMLVDAARVFAASRAPFVVPRLTVRVIGDFVALTPDAPNTALDRLAADCVVAFEPLRAPLSAFDRDRRVAKLTDPHHVASVDRWGYPWVFEDFRFHMTLTGRLPRERWSPVVAGLSDLLAGTTDDVVVDAISIFRQDDRAGPFRVVARLPFETFDLV